MSDDALKRLNNFEFLTADRAISASFVLRMGITVVIVVSVVTSISFWRSVWLLFFADFG
jgi:hypothetical protein